MYQAFMATGGRGVWHITQNAMASIIQMAGPSGNASYIWQPSARDGVPDRILGLPVLWTEKLPTAGQAGDILLANWPYYYVGDRQRTTIESTNIELFRYDKTSWRCVHRVDGQPALSAPLTLADGVSQISPFVILGAKSS
jgi:HK97 family phage major capsid protein